MNVILWPYIGGSSISGWAREDGIRLLLGGRIRFPDDTTEISK